MSDQDIPWGPDPTPWGSDAEAESSVSVVPTKDRPLDGLESLSRVAVVGADAIERLAAEPIVYVWDDIAIAGIIVALAGGPGCGKTTLLFWILVARMNVGEPVAVLGREVTPAPAGMFIVLIEGEHGERSAARKLVRTCRLARIQDPHGALGRIILVARKSVRLGSPEWEDVERLVSAGLVSDIALDTLARVAPGDSNDEKDQVAIFDLVSRAVDRAPDESTKPVVWANMHTRKGGGTDLEAVSGSTQRTGQADTVLLMRATKDKDGGRVTSSKVTFAKLREDPEEYPTACRFEVTADAFVMSDEESDAPKDDRPLETRILERLAVAPATAGSLSRMLDRSYQDIQKAISALFDARRLTTKRSVVGGRERKSFALRDDYRPGPDPIPGEPPQQDTFSSYLNGEGIE